MEIKGFEGEDIKVSKFGEWVGPSYIDYKFEYNNQIKIIKDLYNKNQQLKEKLEASEKARKETIEYIKEFLCTEYYCSQGKELYEFCSGLMKQLDIDKGEMKDE